MATIATFIRKAGLAAAVSAVAVVAASPVLANTLRTGDGYMPNVLPRNDDGSTGAVPMGFGVNFYGLNVSSTFVNNNGNITFDQGLSSFTPFDLTSTGRQIIAPFFADVDTRNVLGGVVDYGMATIDGRQAFIVNWPMVGYYSNRVDLLNNFQLVIIDRSDIAEGDFDFEFNYAQIQWETGGASGGVNGLGGSSARAGFSNGSGDAGTFLEIPGSAENGAFLDSNLTTGLIHTSNVGVPGRWRFMVRSGSVILRPDFISSAHTYNQRQVAGALDTFNFGGENAGILNALNGLSGDLLRAAFDAATGEIHASGQHAIVQATSLFARMLAQRARMGVGQTGVQAVPLAFSTEPRPQSLPAGIMAADAHGMAVETYAHGRSSGAWFAPLGGLGTVKPDGNAAETDWWTGGVSGGYEWAGPSYIAGLSVGYLRSRADVDARNQTLTSNGFNFGAYGGWASGPWSVSGSAAFAADRISTTRNINFGGLARTATASYWAHSFSVYGEAAYAVDLSGGLTLSPIATLDAGVHKFGAATETGAGGLNLNIAARTLNRVDTGLGVALASTFTTETGLVTLDARVLWEHAFGDRTPTRGLSFASSPTAFAVNGTTASRDRVRVEIGAELQASETVSVSARYGGSFARNDSSHSAFASVKVKF